MDHHIPRAITAGLRIRGVDVLTAYEDGMSAESDSALLDRATFLERILFTQDEDLLNEATGRQRTGVPFYGIVYAHQLRVSVGKCIQDLELIAATGYPQEFLNQVQYLPL